MKEEVTVLSAKELKDICYFMPTPKSPHGCDVDPTGEYIIGSGKLAAMIPVHSFSKMLKAIEKLNNFREYGGIPILKYESHFMVKFKTRFRSTSHRV